MIESYRIPVIVVLNDKKGATSRAHPCNMAS